MFHYTSFGLNIASEIAFPEMFVCEEKTAADVHIRIGITPKFIADGETENPDLWITPDKYLIHFKDMSWFYAENGNLVIAEPCKNAVDKSIRLYLLCNAMAAIIHQRKLIPLHASGIVVPNGVALIVGHSGAGKSTTIKALTKKGHKIFSDDVCVLKSEGEKILAVPSYPMMKLWEHSFDLLELGAKNEDHKIKFDMNKYAVFFHKEFISTWMPVIKIFTIVKDEDAQEVMIKKMNGIDAFVIIGENTYRNQYVEPMKLNALHFKMVSGLVQQCEVLKITRPAGRDSISEVVEIIEKELNI